MSLRLESGGALVCFWFTFTVKKCLYGGRLDVNTEMKPEI